jgi:mono/diheme cytochrome c family protein
MSKSLKVVAVLWLFSFCTFAQESQPAAKAEPSTPAPIPAEAARQPNPVKSTAESISAGKKWYGYDCAMCHGKDGTGKGDVAIDMKLKMNDLTDPASLKDWTDGELFYTIKNGRGEMPPEGDRLKSNDFWNLVNYVRSMAKKKVAVEQKTGQ